MTPEEARKQLKHLVLYAQFAEGERLARQIRDDATHAKDQKLAADATFFLGQCCFEALRFQDAWDAFADTLAEWTELYGPNHLRTTQARAWLAGVSISLQRHAEARSLLERAKSAVPKAPAEDERLMAADTLKAIGFVETRLNNTNSALDHLRRSLELAESAKDAGELDIASICVILGMAEQTAKHIARAEQLFQRALDIRVRLLGEDNQLVAYCRNHLGITKMLQGNSKDAQKLVETSIADIEATQDNRSTATSLSTRGAIPAREEDHTRAIDALEKAFVITDGDEEETPEVAQTLIMLGLVQLGFEKPDLAEPHFRRAVKILLPLHQSELDTLFKAFNNMLMVLNAQRKFKEVLAFVEPILDKLQHEALVDPGFLAAVMAGLSTGHYGLKKFVKAEKLLRRALGVVESRLGPDAQELEPILSNLSQLLDEMGRRSEARTYAKRCAEIQAKHG
jgi:tetratricopeptide (TPR) repeat protein